MAPMKIKNLIEILEVEHPIDVCKYIATFSGTTRDTFNGKTVVERRYEAYVPMTLCCIKSICSSARSLWNLSSIAVVHCLGPVAVVETSVFVAISSVHRPDAMDACKFLIDEIKASVPMWNKEVWKRNAEFLERVLELAQGLQDESRTCNNGKVEMEGNNRSCCGEKVDNGAEDSFVPFQ